MAIDLPAGERVLTGVEEKLVRLVLDPAARGGEISTSFIKLVESWRQRGVQPEQIIGPLSSRFLGQPDALLERAGAKVMPFGKHRGKRLDQVPEGYLQWCLRECSSLSLVLREAIRLILKERGAR